MSILFSIFYLSCFLVFIVSALKYKLRISLGYLFGFIAALAVSLAFSFRDILDIHDAVVYMGYFREYSDFSSIFNGSYAWKEDYFFFFIGYFFKLFSNDDMLYMQFFYFLNSIFFFFTLFLITLKVGRVEVFIIILFVLSSSSFYFLYGNVVRQGLALSLFLLFTYLSIINSTILIKVLMLLVTACAYYSHKAVFILFLAVLFLPILKKTPYISFLLLGSLISYISSYFYKILLSIVGVEGSLILKLDIYQQAGGQHDVFMKFLITFCMLFLAGKILNFCKLRQFGGHSFIQVTDIFYFSATTNFFISVLMIPFAKIATRFLLYSDILLALLIPLSITFVLNRTNRVAGMNKQSYKCVILLLCFGYSIIVFSHPAIESLFGGEIFPVL